MSHSEKDGKANRSVRGMVVRPKAQLKLALVMAFLCLAFLGFFLVLTMLNLTRMASDVALSYPQAAEQIQSQTGGMLGMMAAYVSVLGVFSVCIGFALSHRIYGPMVPIQRHVDALKRGELTSRIHLRTSDEFQELAQSLNELAEELEKKR